MFNYKHYLYVMFKNGLIDIELNKILSENLGGQFNNIEEAITKKQFLVGDLGITYRWLTHWDQKDLLISKEETSKWRRYDFVDFVWIKMIQKMRVFNLSLAQIKIIKDQLIQDITYEEAINVEEIRKVVKALSPMVEDTEIDRILDDALESGEPRKEKINFLKLFILDAIILKNHFALLLNDEMEIVIYKESFREQYLKIGDFKKFLLGSHLNISITELLVDFIKLNDLDFSQNALELITVQEKEVLQYLRDHKDLKSVNIFFKEGRMDLLELVQVKKIDLSHRLTEVIMNRGYEEITIKTQNGHIVHCENTRKIKLKGTK
jgi:DNA-binding transcriptional MerR regulator